MLSRELEVCLNVAFKQAREKRHEFMTVEHLLLAILDTPRVNDTLMACGADVEKLRRELRAYIDEHTPSLESEESRDVQPTLGFQRVLQRAVFHVQSSGETEVTAANVLVAIFGEKESQAVYLLGRQDISRLDVVNYVSHGISRIHDDEGVEGTGEETDEETEAETGKTALDTYATNLNRAPRKARSIRSSVATTKSNAPFRSSAGVARITRCMSGKRAWARPRLPKAWHA